MIRFFIQQYHDDGLTIVLNGYADTFQIKKQMTARWDQFSFKLDLRQTSDKKPEKYELISSLSTNK